MIYDFIHQYVKYIVLQLKPQMHAVHLSGRVKNSLKNAYSKKMKFKYFFSYLKRSKNT